MADKFEIKNKATRIDLCPHFSPQMRAFHMTWFAFHLCFFAWFGIAPLMAVVRAEILLTNDQIMTTVIASVAITVFARLFIGYLCDRIGPRLSYFYLLIFASIPIMAIGLAHDYTLFLLFRLLIGAVGASFVITQFHTSVMFAPNVVGTANATTAGWGNLGGGTTQSLMPTILILIVGAFASSSGIKFTGLQDLNESVDIRVLDTVARVAEQNNEKLLDINSSDFKNTKNLLVKIPDQQIGEWAGLGKSWITVSDEEYPDSKSERVNRYRVEVIHDSGPKAREIYFRYSDEIPWEFTNSEYEEIIKRISDNKDKEYFKETYSKNPLNAEFEEKTNEWNVSIKNIKWIINDKYIDSTKSVLTFDPERQANINRILRNLVNELKDEKTGKIIHYDIIKSKDSILKLQFVKKPTKVITKLKKEAKDVKSHSDKEEEYVFMSKKPRYIAAGVEIKDFSKLREKIDELRKLQHIKKRESKLFLSKFDYVSLFNSNKDVDKSTNFDSVVKKTKYWGWRLSMLVAGIVCLLIGILYYFVTTDLPDGNYKQLIKRGEHRPSSQVKGTFAMALKDYRVWMLFILYGACFGMELHINNIAALYFIDYFGLGIALAGFIAMLFGLMNIFARTMGGAFGDVLGHKWGLKGRVFALFIIVLCEGLALVLFSRIHMGIGLGFAVATMVFFSLFVQMAEGATFAVVPFINKRALGSIAGIVGAGGNVGAVGYGIYFRVTGVDWADGLMYLGIGVAVVSFVALIIKFSPEAEVEAREEHEKALNERREISERKKKAKQDMMLDA